MNRQSRERLGVMLFSILFMLGFYALWRALGVISIVPAISVVLGVLLLLAFDFKRSIRRDGERNAAQLQQFVELHAALALDHPLPPLGGYSIEPDCASLLAQHILRHRPRLIVEAGSGASTIVAAYCLRRIGEGKVVSLENHREWVDFLTRDLEWRGLSEFAEVRYAPLEPQLADGREWPWFAVAAQQFDAPIDLLFVDGPPTLGRRKARFPAVPILADRLNQEAWVICDDAHRRGERQSFERWKEMFPLQEQVIHPTKKGTAVIRIKRSA